MGREAGGQVPWNAGGWVGRPLCLLFRAGGGWGAWWDLAAEQRKDLALGRQEGRRSASGPGEKGEDLWGWGGRPGMAGQGRRGAVLPASAPMEEAGQARFT